MSNPSPAEQRSDAHWRGLALLWLTGILAVRLLALAFNRTDLMFDEAQYWAWAQEPAFGYFSKPPLLAWIIAAATGICGDGEACLRAPAPLLYWGTGLFIFLAAEALYSARTGFWAALLFTTTPGASFSSGLISTDLPLLFCWSAALYAWARLLQTRGWRWAVMLGLAIEIGLNAKYAMAYFFLCGSLAIWRCSEARWLAASARLVPVLVLPLMLILPNVIWNASHGFPTFTHTAANAGWSGALFHPLKMLEFVAAQFGVFGPILFGAFVWLAWRSTRTRLTDPDRMLLAFSLPVLTLIIAQALLSRAHANWAAVAYPAAAILVSDALLRNGFRVLLQLSLALNIAVMGVLAAANWAAPVLALPWGAAPYKRLLGWHAMADAARAHLSAGNYTTLLTEDRWVTAELLYYLRDLDIPVRAWSPEPHPRDHFELTRPFSGDAKGPYLLVTLRPSVSYLTNRFSVANALESVTVPAGPGQTRRVRFFALERYRGE